MNFAAEKKKFAAEKADLEREAYGGAVSTVEL